MRLRKRSWPGVSCMRECKGAYLARRVPQLEADGAVLEIHSFCQKVDANCGLIGRVESVIHKTCKRVGKVLRGNATGGANREDTLRVMIEVLPTAWSPRKTSLYLASGLDA